MKLQIKLTPGSSCNRIEAPDSAGVLKVKVTARPVDNAANEALVKVLSKALRLPKSAITLVRGQTSRNKQLDIAGINRIPEELHGKDF